MGAIARPSPQPLPALSADRSAAPRPATLELAIHNPGGYPGLGLRALRRWLTALVAELAPQATSLGVLLSSDRRLAELNRYRAKTGPTDVLSFPGEHDGDDDVASSELLGVHLGDIAISVPTARRQAAAAGHSLERELRILLLHGVLHCLGHDHETDGGEMERLERRLRRRWLDADG